MKYITDKSLAQIEESVKLEFIKKYQNLIDNYNKLGFKLLFDFKREKVSNSNQHIFIVMAYILPNNISKSEALKKQKIKCFAGKLLKIYKNDNEFSIYQYRNVLLSQYLTKMLHKLQKDNNTFFKDNIFDLILKIMFPKRVGKLADNYNGKDISFFPLIVILIITVIFAIIGSYYDVLISKNLGW